MQQQNRVLSQLLRSHVPGLGLIFSAWLVFFWRQIFHSAVLFYEDTKVVFYPLEHVYAQFQQAGELPLWSNTFGFGHPLLAWGQLGFFTPVNFFLRALHLHPLVVIQLSLMIYFGLGLLGFYVFLYRRAFTHLAAALGAVVFVFSGYNVSHIVHLNFPVGVMIVPWLLVSLDCLFSRPTLRRAVSVGLLSAIIVLSAHAQIALYCLFLSAIVSIFLVRNYTWRLVGCLGIAAFIGFALSSLVILPLLEFLPATDRAAGITTDELYNFSYPPWHAVTLIFPTYYGDITDYHGEKSFQELSAYFGIIPLLLAGAGLISRPTKHTSEKKIAIALLLVSLLVIFGKYSFLYRFLVENNLFPPFTAPSRLLLFATLGLALLTAIGLDSLRFNVSWRSRLAGIIGGLSLLLVILAPAALTYKFNLALVDPLEFWLAVVGLLVFLSAMALINKGASQLWSTACVVVTLCTLLWFGWNFYPLTPRAPAMQPSIFSSSLAKFAAQTGIPPRLYSETELLQQPQPPPVESLKRTDFLTKNFFVRQPIQAEQDSLSCLELQLESNLNDVPLRLSLIDIATNTVIRSALAPITEQPPHWQQFCFAPIEGSAGQQYLVDIKSDENSSNVRLFYEPAGDYARQAFFIRVPRPTENELLQSKKQARLKLRLLYGEESDPQQQLLLRHMNVLAGAGSARWIGSLSVGRYHDFVRGMFANDLATVDGDGQHILRKNRKMFDSAGVTHFLQTLPPDRQDIMARHGFRVAQEEVIRGITYRLYENEQVLPRAFLVPNAVISNDQKTTLAAMQRPDFDPRRLVYIEDVDGNVNHAPAASVDPESSAKITRYDPARVDVEVISQQPVWLVLADTYVPGWQTYINNQASPRYVADQLFRAAYVPAGQHIISFRYESMAVKWAARLFLLGAIFTVIVLAWPRFFMRT